MFLGEVPAPSDVPFNVEKAQKRWQAREEDPVPNGEACEEERDGIWRVLS